ncbi:glycosyltransferase [Candidatus Uhrbacteria bacterium]|nr:glycosyltransferase [Candidatus Uhrbacteria bacterium]
MYDVQCTMISMLHLTIPTRNEAPYITDTLRRLSKSLTDLTTPWQIIIADNGSTDNIADKLNEFRTPDHRSLVVVGSYTVPRTNKSAEPVFGTRHDVQSTNLVYLDCPKVGKGAAILYAANHSYLAPPTSYQKQSEPSPLYDVRYTMYDKSVFGFIDADLSADPDAIPGMVNRILEDKADIVIASRLLITKTTNRSWLRTISSQAFNFLADLVLKLDVEDAQCGLKIMNEKGLEVLKSCQEDGWFLDIELLAHARKNNLRIVEIPVPWIEFRYPERKSQIKHFKDGIEAIKAIFRINRTLRTSYVVHRTKRD